MMAASGQRIPSRSRSTPTLQSTRGRPAGAGRGRGRLAAAATALLACALLFLLASTLSASPGASSAACRGEDLDGTNRAGRLPRNASIGVVVSHWEDENVAWVGSTVAAVRSTSAAAAAVHIYQLRPGGDSDGVEAIEPGPVAIRGGKKGKKGQKGKAGGGEEEEQGGASLDMRSARGEKGAEAMAFLSGILDEWDSLPDAMAFLHGHDSSWHSRVPNSWVLSHLLERPPASLLSGYLGTQCREPGGEYNFRLRPNNVSANVHRDQPGARYLAQAWSEYFGQHLGPLPSLVSAPCCAEFVVSRAAIQRRPKEFYDGARQWIEDTSLNSKQAARALEYAWHVIFTNKTVLAVPERTCLCSLYHVPVVCWWDSRLLALLALPPGLAAGVLLCPLLRSAMRRPGRQQRLPM